MDVYLVTCKVLPEPDPDAQPLSDALNRAGIAHEVRAWDDETVDWSRPKLAILRSPWNYHVRNGPFRTWLSETAARTRLLNPLAIVEWNMHKGYLLELEAAGVPVTPTELVRVGDPRSLEQIMRARGWHDVVVKPAISGGSFETLRASAEDLAAGEAHLRRLTAERDMLVQRYLDAVEDYGERALMWIDGALTHAVRKTPRFLGDDEHVSEAMPISDAERALAERCLDQVDGDLLYARIDVAPGPLNDPVLMELELIEPSLFFPQHPPALERYAAGVQRLLSS